MNTMDKNIEIEAQPQISTHGTNETKIIVGKHDDTEAPELTNEDMLEKGINHKPNLDYSYTVILVRCDRNISSIIFLFTLGNEKSKTSLFKRILPVALFDVGLPSLDVYSDLSLIIGWFISGNPIYALAMCVPFLLQNLSTIYKWYEIEKPESKKWSWSFY